MKVEHSLKVELDEDILARLEADIAARNRNVAAELAQFLEESIPRKPRNKKASVERLSKLDSSTYNETLNIELPQDYKTQYWVSRGEEHKWERYYTMPTSSLRYSWKGRRHE